VKTIHVLRKPCSEPTVASNVLRYGVGGIHIDATRISFISEADEAESKTKNQHADFGSAPVTGNVTYGDYSMVPPKNYNPPGRWPANLILQHLDGCVKGGTREVVAARWRDSDKPHNPDSPTDNFGAGSVTGRHYGKNGKEVVEAWTCTEGCPVAALDAQSGNTKAVTRKPTGKPIYATEGSAMVWNSNSVMDSTERGFTDEGGASRFFKQVKSR
jgi:hypothetical protein